MLPRIAVGSAVRPIAVAAPPVTVTEPNTGVGAVVLEMQLAADGVTVVPEGGAPIASASHFFALVSISDQLFVTPVAPKLTNVAAIPAEPSCSGRFTATSSISDCVLVVPAPSSADHATQSWPPDTMELIAELPARDVS